MSIFITGTGLTKFGELYDKSLLDLALEASHAALEDARLSIEDIDAIYIGNMLGGELEGASHFGARVVGALGRILPSVRVESACASGSMAAVLAKQAILSGEANRVLVLGAEKMTDQPTSVITKALMQAASEREQEAGFTFPALYAAMASAYEREFGLNLEDLADFSVSMHSKACAHPEAQYHKQFTRQQVAGSMVVAGHLRLLHCSPISDGAAVLVLESDKAAGFEMSRAKAQLEASVFLNDTPDLMQRPIQHGIPAAKMAMKKLVDKHPGIREEIDLIELHDCFAIAGFMALEDLGFCEAGKAGDFLKTSTLNVNPSGGLKAFGHPVGATGVKQLVIATRHMKKAALTHNVGGTGGSVALHYLSRVN